MRTVATWCVRHRRIVVIGWLVLVAGLLVGSQAAGPSYDNSLSLPGTESARATALLKANAPAAAGDIEQVVLATRGMASLEAPAVRVRVEALLAKLATFPGVTGFTSPYAAEGAGQISTDRTVAFAPLHFAQPAELVPTDRAKALVRMARAFRSPELDVAVEGPISVAAGEGDLGGVGLGIIAAAVVLFLVFGSLLASALPLVSTLLALPAAISVIGLVSHVIVMPDFSVQVMMLIGLGVGIDYALFIVVRMRQGLQAGEDVESAIASAVATSGRAVLFAGAVVCIAMLGLSALGLALLTGLGVAASIGVLFTMATSLTLLPALLGFFGTKVLSRRQRRQLALHAMPAETGLWWQWSAVVARRPALPAVLAIAVIGALAVPFLSLRLGSSDEGNGSPSTSSRQAYDLLAKGFGPGFNGPLQLVVQLTQAGDDDALGRLQVAVAADPSVAAVTMPRLLPGLGGSRIAVLTAYARSAPQDTATTELVQRLRQQVIPQAVKGSGVHAYVGGSTATSFDLGRGITRKIPLFVALVVLLSFLLLTVVFHSLLIPLVAAAMNLLSAVAAFGTMSAVYVWGWGGSLLGADRAGPIEAPMPVMIFAILFGLSMDYQVFLVARIQEEWRRTQDNRLAISRGLAITGRTITAAAIIMILVFGSFILGGDRTIKEFGLGLAVAVFVDAFLVRVALVPAVMLLLGKVNWWLPRGLDSRLPQLSAHDEQSTRALPQTAVRQ